MPRLLDYLAPLYAWLVAIDPSLPRAFFVALVFATVLAWRKYAPGSWSKFSAVIPVSEADTNWLKVTLQKLWQAVPAALLGAVYGALGTGGDVAATVKLAMLGLVAPVIHEVAWRYQGKLGTPSGKLPPPSDGSKPFGREVFPQDGDGKPLSVRPPGGFDAEFRGWRHREWSFAVVALVLVGCGAAAPVAPPCDQATLIGIVTECTIRSEECASKGVPEGECAALAECDQRLDKRAEVCR